MSKRSVLHLRGSPFHEDISSEALQAFVKQNILTRIIAQHAFVDGTDPFAPEFHFDSCHFQEAVDNINHLYNQILHDLVPLNQKQNFNDAADQFGKVLHVVQDFYSHSNWVDMGRTDTGKDLIDSGDRLWTPMLPYEKLPKS